MKSNIYCSKYEYKFNHLNFINFHYFMNQFLYLISFFNYFLLMTLNGYSLLHEIYSFPFLITNKSKPI